MNPPAALCKFVLIMFFLSGWDPLPAADVQVALEIGGNGPRPYVAVWVEDAEGQRVKTLQVWGPKRKYHRDLRTWHRTPEAVDGITGATRPNGTYRTTWDGTNAGGHPVAEGTYRILAESVREEGRRCLSQCTLILGKAPVRAEGKADGDIRSLTVQATP
jgi:hypothetical protein